MTGKEVGFWTHDIVTGEKRHHPTLECVADAEPLALQIEKLRLAAKNTVNAAPERPAP